MSVLLKQPIYLALTTNAFSHSGRDEDPDPLIFGPPDPVLFSTDPEPTSNNGFIKLFSS